MKKILSVLFATFACIFGLAANAMAAFTLPELPTTDLESAGTAVAALVAVIVVIGAVIRLLKKA